MGEQLLMEYEYHRKVDKSLIPTCDIMGVKIAAINMDWILKFLDENLSDIKLQVLKILRIVQSKMEDLWLYQMEDHFLL